MKSVKARRILLFVIPFVALLVIGLLLFWLSDVLLKQKSAFLTEAPICVHFVDVGQGDCAVVETPEGNLLIDAGPAQSAEDILRFLQKRGISEFAYAFFSHPHADHIGGAEAILNACPAKAAVLSDAASTSWQQESLLTVLAASDTTVYLAKAGETYTLGGLSAEIICTGAVGEDLNNASIILKLTYKDISFLFVGDAEAELEEKLLSSCPQKLSADVLKVGHHGSSSSSTEAFLQAVKPSYAVISVGSGNAFGHPAYSVLRRLKAVGAKVYRTDEQGSITVATDGNTVTVSRNGK